MYQRMLLLLPVLVNYIFSLITNIYITHTLPTTPYHTITYHTYLKICKQEKIGQLRATK